MLELIPGKTTIAEASRQFDLTPAEIECCVEEVREQDERDLRDLQEVYRESILELRPRKKLASLLGKNEG